jgi:hypothetical protein
VNTVYSSLGAIFVFVLFASPLAAKVGIPWDQQINKPTRFKVLNDFDGTAFLDRETGLVWEKSPDSSGRGWHETPGHCYTREVGGRKGWRLPTIEELASLLDTSNSMPALPSGHPFTLDRLQQMGNYWSATTWTDGTDHAWVAHFINGGVGVFPKNFFAFALCVRGGQGIVGVP